MNINEYAPQSGNMLDAESDVHNILDSFTGAKRTIDIDHNYIHLKKRFTAFHKATIISGGTLAISLVTPANGYIHYRGLKPSPSADLVDIQIFEGATINVAGTQLNPTNRSRTGTPPSSTVELRYGTTFSNNGTELTGLREFYPGTSAPPVRAGGGNSANEEVVLRQNTTYRILITNGSASSNILGLTFNWYEESEG